MSREIQTTKLSDADYIREFKSQKSMETIPEVRAKNERLERIAQALEGITCRKLKRHQIF